MSKKIVIDCGHGGNNSTAGKRSSVSVVGQMIYEWDMNNAVCNYIQEMLRDYDVIVYRTDDKTGKTDVSLAERVRRTNNYNPDVFVSIHHNAGGGTGVETYWHTLGSSQDKKLATCIQSRLPQKTGLRNRGVKQASFYVLGCKSSIPAVLVEGGFYDTKHDFDILMSEQGRRGYAEAVVEGIVEFLGLVKIRNTTTSTTVNTTVTTPTVSNTTDKHYRVVIGSYTVKTNAQSKLNEVTEKGVDAFLAVTDVNGKTYYRVVSGSYSNRDNAVVRQNELKKMNIETFLVFE